MHRYHAPSDVPIGPPPTSGSSGGGGGCAGVHYGQTVSGGGGEEQQVQSAMYTMVHMTGARFAEMCVVDHREARRPGGSDREFRV